MPLKNITIGKHEETRQQSGEAGITGSPEKRRYGKP